MYERCNCNGGCVRFNISFNVCNTWPKMKDLVNRLSSRKFWLAVASFITFVVNEQYTEAMGVVLAYLGVEGYRDAVKGNSGAIQAQNLVSQNDDDVIVGEVTTGNKVNSPLFDEELKEDLK